VVPDAGVVPALRLGESAGLYDLLEEALTVDSPNATAKTTCVVGGTLADADSVDDLETRVEVNRGQLPLPDCVGEVGHPLRRLRADLLQGHPARVHALEQADSGAEQHG
jgi:hypothetical protein